MSRSRLGEIVRLPVDTYGRLGMITAAPRGHVRTITEKGQSCLWRRDSIGPVIARVVVTPHRYRANRASPAFRVCEVVGIDELGTRPVHVRVAGPGESEETRVAILREWCWSEFRRLHPYLLWILQYAAEVVVKRAGGAS